MSIREVAGRPGWHDVRVYDRVRVPGERPKPIDRRVKGLRAAQAVERELLAMRDAGSLVDRNISLTNYGTAYFQAIAYSIVFIPVIVILLVKPEGLLGKVSR